MQDHAHRPGMQEHEHLMVAPALAQVPAISMPLQLGPELPPGVAPPLAAVLQLGRQAAQPVTRHTTPRHRVRPTQLPPRARTVAHPHPVSQHLHPEPGLTAHRHRVPTTRRLRLTLAIVHTMHRRQRWVGLPLHRAPARTAMQTMAVPGTKKERPVLECIFRFLLGIFHDFTTKTAHCMFISIPHLFMFSFIGDFSYPLVLSYIVLSIYQHINVFHHIGG